MKKCDSLADFAHKYDAFILDIWGVIHDGVETYPDVVECLQALRGLDKKIIFLSNAPRRAEKVKNVLAKFGITQDLYDDAISSGEAAYHILSKLPPKSTDLGMEQRGTPRADGSVGLLTSPNKPLNYIYIGPEKDRDLLDGLDLQEVENAAEADFAVATGFDDDHSILDEKLPQILDCMEHNLKMYCVNPDLLVVRQDGSKMLCAGVIGEHYRDNGYKVEFIGKPYRQVYQQCFDLLAGIPLEKICAVGDNLDTDIMGANDAGIDSALCLGGVLMNSETPIEELSAKIGAAATYSIPAFKF